MAEFLSELVEGIGMQRLFDPIAIDGKYGFTGIVGIVTSHIAFHYFDHDRSLRFDVYSCKEYSLAEVMRRIDAFWRVESARIIMLDRELGRAERYLYFNKQLTKE